MGMAMRASFAAGRLAYCASLPLETLNTRSAMGSSFVDGRCDVRGRASGGPAPDITGRSGAETLDQVRTTYGTKSFAAGAAIVAGAVVVRAAPDDCDRFRSPATIAGAAQQPSSVGGAVALTMMPTQ